MTQPCTYTGREYDPETGLYYYRARYYDPKIGRFLQEDPVWDVNLYPYVGNNPINWIDPWGKDAITIGPITIYYNQAGMTPGEKAGERAHEKQHRDDWLKNIPGWKKEQRGFAAQAEVLKKWIVNLTSNGCLSKAEERELSILKTELKNAETIATSDWAAKMYWNTAPVRLPWQKVKLK